MFCGVALAFPAAVQVATNQRNTQSRNSDRTSISAPRRRRLRSTTSTRGRRRGDLCHGHDLPPRHQRAPLPGLRSRGGVAGAPRDHQPCGRDPRSSDNSDAGLLHQRFRRHVLGCLAVRAQRDSTLMVVDGDRSSRAPRSNRSRRTGVTGQAGRRKSRRGATQGQARCQ